MSPGKRCPRCAEQIRAEARLCRYCGHEFDSDADGLVVTRWIRAHPAVTTTLAMFLYVAFQIHKAGDFEVVTTVELLHSGSLPVILAGVVLVQLPLELLILSIFASWWLFATGEMVNKAYAPLRSAVTRSPMLSDPRTLPQSVLVAVVLASFYTSPWPFFLLAFVVGSAATIIARRRKVYRRGMSVWAPRVLAAGISVLFLIMLGRPTSWVPAEAVTTTSGQVLSGYVVSADGDWTTLLTPRWTGRLEPSENSLRRVPSADVTARETCVFSYDEAFGTVTRLRTLQLISVAFGGPWPVGMTPSCP